MIFINFLKYRKNLVFQKRNAILIVNSYNIYPRKVLIINDIKNFIFF